MNKKRWFNMKKTEQIGNIKIIIDDSYCHNENIDDILKECGKLVNTVNLRKKIKGFWLL